MAHSTRSSVRRSWNTSTITGEPPASWLGSRGPEAGLAVTIPTATSEHFYLRVGDDYFESPGGHIRIFRPRQLALGLADAGLATIGVGFAHALHTPYWVLRSIAGLPRADDNALVQIYRRFLLLATKSRFLTRLEEVLNYCFPKSLILYAKKRHPIANRGD